MVLNSSWTLTVTLGSRVGPGTAPAPTDATSDQSSPVGGSRISSPRTPDLTRRIPPVSPVPMLVILSACLASPVDAATQTSTSSPTSAVAVAPLDLAGLTQQLRETSAIGLFTKLSLRNQVDDLLAEFRAFYKGGSQFTLAHLRQDYEVLLLKVVSLLQDGDPSLADEVSSSREAIWRVLSNPKKFATV
jgi:hypothetical protein